MLHICYSLCQKNYNFNQFAGDKYFLESIISGFINLIPSQPINQLAN